MKLDHFFGGTVRKEDVASAFLATALEQSPRFRAHFFRLVDADQASTLATKTWTCTVEQRRVDVPLRTAGTTVIIENKICAGARQAEQLVRYYRECVETIAPADRILAVYVAPRDLGKGEVQLVNDLLANEPRGSDRAVHLSWRDLSQFDSPEDQDAEIAAGLATIVHVIEELRQPKYLREGDRDILATRVDGALQTIRAKTGVPLGRWTGAAVEEITTAGTNVTMWVDAMFEADKDPPHAPIGLYDGNQLTLRLGAKFKLAGHVKKSDALSKWWAAAVLQQTVEIEGVGRFAISGKGWLVYQENLTGSPDLVERRLSDVGTSTLHWLAKRLAEAGFPLLRRPA